MGYLINSKWGLYERGSYSFAMRDTFNFDKIIFGNYMPHFGQGLLFGGGYPLYIYNPYYDLGKFRDSINISKSYSKSSILEGIVAVYSIGNIKIRPFLSWNFYDCSAGESNYYLYNDNDFDGISNDEDDNDFTNKKDSFPGNYSCKYSLEKAITDETTYSSDEYNKRRNRLTEYIAGINSSVELNRCIVGLTFFYSGFNRMIDPYYNFDPNSGDKTAYYFRGKNYIAAETYFRSTGKVQFFYDIVGSYYNSLSYYDEFSGKGVLSVGFLSGLRSKINNVSILLWGGYVPANLINPHAVEFPWGRRNFASIVGNMGFISNRANFTHWIEFSKELFDIDNPNSGEEVDFSYNYNFFYDFINKSSFKLKQKFEVIDNYYYFPESRSYKIVTKISVKHELSKHIGLTDILEYRVGKEDGTTMVKGIGIGGRITVNKNDNQFKGMIFGYITADSVLASLYPYEPSIYRWSFLPSSLNGKGILFSFSFTRDLFDSITTGFKIRYNMDIVENNNSSLKFYLDTEARF